MAAVDTRFAPRRLTFRRAQGLVAANPPVASVSQGYEHRYIAINLLGMKPNNQNALLEMLTHPPGPPLHWLGREIKV